MRPRFALNALPFLVGSAYGFLNSQAVLAFGIGPFQPFTMLLSMLPSWVSRSRSETPVNSDRPSWSVHACVRDVSCPLVPGTPQRHANWRGDAHHITFCQYNARIIITPLRSRRRCDAEAAASLQMLLGGQSCDAAQATDLDCRPSAHRSSDWQMYTTSPSHATVPPDSSARDRLPADDTVV